ncbi:MAG: hypothetical protein J6U98_02425 [Abditibacteriota bacterium]|nr:hypothetical protein [Abditibacteriota bacterium]
MKKLIAAIAIISLLAVGAAMARTVTAEDDLNWEKIGSGYYWYGADIDKTDDGVMVYYPNIDWYDDMAGTVKANGTWNINGEAGDDISLCFNLGHRIIDPQNNYFGIFNDTKLFYDGGEITFGANDYTYDSTTGDVVFTTTLGNPVATITGVQIYNTEPYYTDRSPDGNNYVHYPTNSGFGYLITDPYFILPGEDPTPDPVVPDPVYPDKTVTPTGDVTWTETYPDLWADLPRTEWTQDANTGDAVIYFTEPADVAAEGGFLTANSSWLVNANAGDEISVVYDIKGVTQAELEGELTGSYFTKTVLTYDNGQTLTITKDNMTIDGTTVIFTTTLADVLDTVNSIDAYGWFYQSQTDGSETYNDLNAIRLTVPNIIAPDRNASTVVPEPATYAYGVLGLLSVMGMKRRIRK